MVKPFSTSVLLLHIWWRRSQKYSEASLLLLWQKNLSYHGRLLTDPSGFFSCSLAYNAFSFMHFEDISPNWCGVGPKRFHLSERLISQKCMVGKTFKNLYSLQNVLSFSRQKMLFYQIIMKYNGFLNFNPVFCLFFHTYIYERNVFNHIWSSWLFSGLHQSQNLKRWFSKDLSAILLLW